jgi:ribosomal-protein-alanine N-acetyltransferase
MTRIDPAPLVITRGGGDDLDHVMTVMKAAFDDSFGEAWTRAQVAGILPMAGVTLLIAWEGVRAVAFSLARRAADEAELLLIAVHPAAARRGIGGKLLDRFVDDQRAEGARHLHLEVRDGNPAVTLYRAHGFTVAGRRSKYYRGPGGALFDALTMVRSA